MELDEAILFTAVIVTLVLVPIIIDKYLNEKWKLWIKGILLFVLAGLFTSELVKDFSYVRLAVTCVFLIVGVSGFLKNYRKYKSAQKP